MDIKSVGDAQEKESSACDPETCAVLCLQGRPLSPGIVEPLWSLEPSKPYLICVRACFVVE